MRDQEKKKWSAIGATIAAAGAACFVMGFNLPGFVLVGAGVMVFLRAIDNP